MDSEKGEADLSEEFWKAVEQIEGLSLQTGLSRVSGEREDYKELLQLVTKEIEKCAKNAKNFLFIKDFKNFRIEVHGIKGSLANIGAAQLSSKALELENASFKEDEAFCSANLPPFLEALQKFKSDITEAFTKDNAVPTKAGEQDELLLDADGNKYFDLATLLIMGDVDFQGVIKKNPSIRVSDYLYLLLKFDNIAAKGVDSLDRIANREADDNDVKILTDITDLLGNLGCTSVISLIENTILAGKKGHTAFASDCAKKAQGDYERKQARILASKKEGKPDDGGRGSSRENFEALPLKDALEQLEMVETTRKLRVLAVDDSPVMLSTINSVLGGEYKVYSMPKPSMVESFLRQITPDLILLDYEMPEINGFELVPIIRNFEELKETPIIFITSMGTIEHISAATVLGARDFIVKPFQADNLLKKVAKHIVRKKIKTGGF